MKQIARFVLTAAMMLASAIGAQAQTPTDPDVTIKAVEKIIEKHKENAEYFIAKEIYPKYRKDAKVLTGIARAYNQKSRVDSSYVFNYLHKALDVDPNYAPAYIVGGTELRQRGDTLAAFEWFDRAIAANPKDSTGYLAYANLLSRNDPEKAINKMREILNHNPKYDINLYAGHLYFDKGDARNAYKYFINADTSRMDSKDFAACVTVLRVQHDYNKADSVLQIANARYPSHFALNRLRLANDISAKKYEHALTAVDILFNKSDSLEVDLNDYINYGKAYVGLNRYKEGIDIFQKCIDYEILRKDYRSDERYENAKSQEGKLKAIAMQEMARSYDKMGYPEEAVAMQLQYTDCRKKMGTINAQDVADLARYYIGLAEIKNGIEKIEVYKKTYEVWGELPEVSPENATLGYYNRIRLAASALDLDNKNGMAVPDAEKIVELVPLTDEIEPSERGRLIYAIGYLASYYFLVKKDNLQAGKYFRMLGKLDSDNRAYKSVYEQPVYRKKLRL